MSKPTPKRRARKRNRGVLAYQQLRALVHGGVIAARVPIEPAQIQPASLDLRLGDTAYRMLSSFLPERSPVEEKLVVQDLFHSNLVMYELDLRKSAVLEKGHVYLIPLMEELALPRTLAAKTNPKSTTGRLDVFARAITDSHARFDEIRPGYRGKLYLEVVPRSFSVRVSTGMCLNQLRVFSGHPLIGDGELRARHKADPLLYGDHAPLPAKDLALDEGLFLRINLKAEGGLVGFRAKKNSQVLDLSRLNHYDPTDFWEVIPQNRHETLLLEPEDFYILLSKERIRIPPEYAAEMVAYEAACGELRTHYAGFFDPGFGYGAGDLRGTPIVLEVRAHDVPFLIHDGQTFFKVLFERMHERPEKVYGQGIGSSYQFQGLTLSKHFKPYRG
jgi:dCTP deaminase